jgi:NADH pyrophosphatase NudC (nudix superfamily)
MGGTVRLRTCPFCGQVPEAQPWQEPGSVMITCIGQYAGQEGYDNPCEAAPSVLGDNADQAALGWNSRTDVRSLHRVEVNGPATIAKATGATS